MNTLYTLLASIDKPPTLPDQPLSSATLQNVLSFVFRAGGVIALLVITVAAFRYVISRGDPEKVKNAKNTILYAVIGLAVAMSGYGIVSFVFRRVQ